MENDFEQPRSSVSLIKGEQDKNNIEWTIEHEKILIEWADKAMCYRWLHARSNSKFNRLNTYYTIPVIIISTLTGTANFAQGRVPAEYQNLYVMVIGAFNLLAGIITTIQQFLKITQLNEAHRVSSIAWDKFYRNIKIELAKYPAERISVVHMIKMSKEEYDRLMETSPVVPDDIVKLFSSSLGHSKDFDRISKPEICDEMRSTDIYRNQWFNEDRVTQKASREIREKMEIELKNKRIRKMHVDDVKQFKIAFYNLNNRDPVTEEIIDNLKEKMELTTLNEIIDELNVTEQLIKDNDDNV